MVLRDAAEYLARNRRKVFWTVALIAIAGLVAVYSICVTQYPISFAEAWQNVSDHLHGTLSLETYRDRLCNYIVWDGLVPRAIVGILVGAVLGVCGAVMQSSIRNPLADPYTTGISSGALLGVSLFVIFGVSIVPGLSYDLGMMVSAFIFALIPCAVVILFSMYRKVTPTVMILIGLAITYIFSACTTLLRYTCSDEDSATIYAWSVGTLGKASWDAVPYLLLIFVLLFAAMMAVSRSLNILSTDDRSAVSMGVNPVRLRIICLIVVSLATTVAVCFTGTIGFVGLVAPHLTRIFVGSNCRYLIPASAAMGGVMLIAADCLARVVGSTGVPVGVVTALVGGPIFLIVLMRQRKSAW